MSKAVIFLRCFSRHEDSEDDTDIEKMELEEVSYEVGWMNVCHVQTDSDTVIKYM